ncbi:hypothetical protein THAOC_33928 [Thalassiosira oceanica]|uniref:Uncharacterized protein n=1 Tax=Thalassiosira oceanica TaxID=159749 RepID=K0R601_THAOC|nr:hypothetical protein THAOC_33928 [Thalassiosira oceanica]|eukprot:EJK47354.1 hypothetical protein THAOC_33928 [Thalassiosira oceanica]
MRDRLPPGASNAIGNRASYVTLQVIVYRHARACHQTSSPPTSPPSQFDRLESGESVSDSVSLRPSLSCQPAYPSPGLRSCPCPLPSLRLSSSPSLQSCLSPPSSPSPQSCPSLPSRPRPSSNPESTDGPVSSFLKFVQSLAEPMPAAVPKPAVRSPSVVQSTPKVNPKPAVTPKPAVELPRDVVSESLVAPPPVVELPPRPAAAPDQRDAIGFAEGWTSRTSRACRVPSPTSVDLHSSAVADFVKKYVEVQPRQKPRPRPRRLRATSHASKKDGDQFHAARQMSLPVGTTARRQFDGRSLDRRNDRCPRQVWPSTHYPPAFCYLHGV